MIGENSSRPLPIQESPNSKWNFQQQPNFSNNFENAQIFSLGDFCSSQGKNMKGDPSSLQFHVIDS